MEAEARQLTVRELSLGGLTLETAQPFDLGSVHEFRLTLGDGAAVLLKGRVMHCRNIARAGDAPLFVSGVQFIDDDGPETDSTVLPKIFKGERNLPRLYGLRNAISRTVPRPITEAI